MCFCLASADSVKDRFADPPAMKLSHQLHHFSCDAGPLVFWLYIGGPKNGAFIVMVNTNPAYLFPLMQGDDVVAMIIDHYAAPSPVYENPGGAHFRCL